MPKFKVVRRAPDDTAGGGQTKLQERVIERPEGSPVPMFGELVEDSTPTSDWTDASAAPTESGEEN